MPDNAETKTVRKSRGLKLTEEEVAPSNAGTDAFPSEDKYPDDVNTQYGIIAEEQDFLTESFRGKDEDSLKQDVE